MSTAPTALIADDEPLLRDELATLLTHAWPELRVVAQARNGREAVEAVDALAPDVCFLDVQMPGLSGVDAARAIGKRAHIVFVTAFDHYALKAFEHGALDYLVKPVEPARLASTVERLRDRLAAPPRATPAGADGDALLQQLAERIAQLQAQSRTASQPRAAGGPLRWIRATVGQGVRLIAVDDIDFIRSDEKYTLVGWRGDGGKPGEALISTPLKTLLPQLDPAVFAQVHRSVAVNLRAVAQVTRGANETAQIHLKHRPEVLPVSRPYLHLFRQM